MCVREAISENGFSLLETTVSLFLGTVFLSAAMTFYLSFWQGYNRIDKRVESYSMALSLRRLMVQDIHSSTSANTQSGGLILLVNGITYRYYLNDNGQCVRVRVGGGTSVLAAGIERFDAGIKGSMVTVHVTFSDHYEETVKAALLTSMEPRGSGTA